ncbi:transposase [Saccharothrix xinjiangensis]|uniref:Transposase n=1 Tax=Saccharothrix xinjiangensis TaxID=204798 RepID=A0ABV9XVK1_9PSEU
MWCGTFQDHRAREEVLTDESWARLEPLVPVRPRRFRHSDRRRADDRAALEGTLCVVRTGIGWNRLPTALFGASGATTTSRHPPGNARSGLLDHLPAKPHSGLITWREGCGGGGRGRPGGLADSTTAVLVGHTSW